MKKLYIILLALALAVVMIIPVATPAAAVVYNAKPAKPVPVSWVSWVTNEKMHLPDFPYTSSAIGKVTKLSDGTTVGSGVSHDIYYPGTSFNSGTSIERYTYTLANFTSSDFHGNVAEFYATSVCKETGQSIRVHYLLIDNGGPGKNKDEIMAWIWLPDVGAPVDAWWPLLGPQDMTDPAFGLPVKITAGDIDVHVGNQGCPKDHH
ncbi:MAG: hypothetical protein ABR886_02955 [Dehalococcoidales bacterium]|jgi:hypothetical protein